MKTFLQFFHILYTRIFPLAVIMITAPAAASMIQKDTTEAAQPDYYMGLKQDEFFQTMLYRERFLLILAENVTEEMWIRRSEGGTTEELGLEELQSPRESWANAYAEELRRIAGFLDEIDALERLAKRRVDYQILERLAALKTHVQKLLEQENAWHSDLSGYRSGKWDTASPGQPDTVQTMETGAAAVLPSAGTENTFEYLFNQWKYDRILEYKLKWTQYHFLRLRLLKNASALQEKRMFQRDLRSALQSFSAGEFALSRLQLRDILNTYSDYAYLDDVLYYLCESNYAMNYLDEALSGYQELMNRYPESGFWPKALARRIYIYSIYNDVGALFETYRDVLKWRNRFDPQTMGILSYMVGNAHFKAGNYPAALLILKNVPAATAYYEPARYVIAACHTNMGNDNQAIAIYEELTRQVISFKNHPVQFQIYNNALLKLGLIYYERGDHQTAMDYLDRVHKDYDHYDLSMIGKAWSAYRSGQPGETLKNVEWVLDHAMISDYAYEARVLAASSNQVLGHSDEALEALRSVYRAGREAEATDRFVAERAMNVKQSHDRQAGNSTTSVEQKYRSLFDEVKEVRELLNRAPSRKQKPVFIRTGDEAALSSERQHLEDKIDRLDEYEAQAKSAGQEALVREIRQLRGELIQTLDEHSRPETNDLISDLEDPIIQRMGMSEYLRYLCQSLLLETLHEKEQTSNDIEKTAALLDSRHPNRPFSLQIQMEMKLEELKDYLGRLNQYEVWIRENFPQELHLDLSQWATFSGYGISNINFSRIKEIDHKIAGISTTIETLEQVYRRKRQDLQYRIQGLLTDVVKIEEQMRLEAMRREENERDRFFQEEYFYKQRQEAPVGDLKEKPRGGKTSQ